MGVFRLRNPLFPVLGFWPLYGGERIRNPTVSKSATAYQIVSKSLGKCCLKEPLNAPFLNGLFSRGFSRGKNDPLRPSGKRPMKVGKRPIKEGNRPINANGQFSCTPPRWKTALLKRPIKRSMMLCENHHYLEREHSHCRS